MTNFKSKPNLISNLISNQQGESKGIKKRHTEHTEFDENGDNIDFLLKDSVITATTTVAANKNSIKSNSGYHHLDTQPDYRSISIGDIILDHSEILMDSEKKMSQIDIDSQKSMATIDIDSKKSMSIKNQKTKDKKKANKKDIQKQIQRKKSTRSCDYCRLKKIRCFFKQEGEDGDGSTQCQNCIKNGLECTFTRVQLKRGPGMRSMTKSMTKSMNKASASKQSTPNLKEQISPEKGKTAHRHQSKKQETHKEQVAAYQIQEPYSQQRVNSIGSASGVALPPLSTFQSEAISSTAIPSEARDYVTSNKNTNNSNTTSDPNNHTYSPSPSLTAQYAYTNGFSGLLQNNVASLGSINYNINTELHHRGSRQENLHQGGTLPQSHMPGQHMNNSINTETVHTDTLNSGNLNNDTLSNTIINNNSDNNNNNNNSNNNNSVAQQFWKVPYNRRDSIVSLTSGISSSSEKSSREDHTNLFPPGLASGVNVERLLMNLHATGMTPNNTTTTTTTTTPKTTYTNHPNHPNHTTRSQSTTTIQSLMNRDGEEPARTVTGVSPRQQEQMNNIFQANPMLQAFLEHQNQQNIMHSAEQGQRHGGVESQDDGLSGIIMMFLKTVEGLNKKIVKLENRVRVLEATTSEASNTFAPNNNTYTGNTNTSKDNNTNNTNKPLQEQTPVHNGNTSNIDPPK